MRVKAVLGGACAVFGTREGATVSESLLSAEYLIGGRSLVCVAGTSSSISVAASNFLNRASLC